MTLNDGTAANDSTSVDIVTAPLAHLATTVSVAPASLTAGDDARFTVTMMNRVRPSRPTRGLSIDVPAGLAVSAIDAGGLACTVSANSISCDPLLLAVNDSRTVVFTARTSAAGGFTVTAVSLTAAVDPDSSNNAASVALTVTTGSGGGPTAAPPPPPTSGATSGGGGGGKLSWLLLAALALALGTRAARRRLSG